MTIHSPRRFRRTVGLIVIGLVGCNRADFPDRVDDAAADLAQVADDGVVDGTDLAGADLGSPADLANGGPPDLTGAVGNGVIHLSVVASRLSGPAPLAVHFDATGTTHMDAGKDSFRELMYTFNFGDPGSGTWMVSGLSRNTQEGGPLASHVFDNPGTYFVTITATDGTNPTTQAVQITVGDPSAHWSGTKTIVVSPSSNFAGAPAGAEQRTTLPSSYDGKRVLLHRGESFDAISIATTDDDVLVGSYGTGPKPIVATVGLGGSGTVADWPDEITVMDLDIGDNFNLETTGSRILVYRCDLLHSSTGDAQINIGTAVGYYVTNGTLPASSYYWPREIFVVDNHAEGDTDGDGHPNLVAMGYFAKSAIMGNRMDKATEHTLRIWQLYKTFIGHNALGGNHYAPNPPGIRAALKIHAGGTAPYDDNIGTSTTSVQTRYLVIADNTFGSPTYPGSWLVGVGPQNNDPGTVEPVIDVVLENNGYIRGPYTSQDVHMLVQRGTTRGNFVVGGGSFGGDVVTVAESTADPAMDPYTGPYFGQLQ